MKRILILSFLILGLVMITLNFKAEKLFATESGSVESSMDQGAMLEVEFEEENLEMEEREIVNRDVRKTP
jgi:hypothetical protein